MKRNRLTGVNEADVREATHYVLGGEHVGRAVGREIRSDGRTVVVVDEPSGQSGHSGTPLTQLPDEIEGTDGPTVVVATRSDRRNRLLAQHARSRLDTSRVLVLVNSPPRLDVFESAGHEPVCATAALSGERMEQI